MTVSANLCATADVMSTDTIMHALPKFTLNPFH